jgi:membrane-associated PAP2 superfamily phosphatase
LRIVVAVVLILIAGVTLVTIAGVDVDLAILRPFYDPVGKFFPAEYHPAFTALRDNGVIAIVTCVTLNALAVAQFFFRRLSIVSIRTAVYLTSSLILGPLVVVNLILKEFWGRYRPFHITQFGGKELYTDWWILGECRRNCSFVSGEVATAAWMFGPAMLLPAPWRNVAMVVVAAYTAFVSVSRMAAGKHFLTDTLFSVLVVLAILMLMQRLVVEPKTAPQTSAMSQ